jgi:uncharacterized protein
MNRRDLVLAVMAAAQGRTYSPVQIQKAVFLVCDQLRDLIDDGPEFNFQPHDYGPFDSDVYLVIESLQSRGLAVIAPSPSGNWNTYAASDAGLAQGDEVLCNMGKSNQRYVQRVSEWVRSLSFKSLVKSIYDAYPHMRANSIFRG